MDIHALRHTFGTHLSVASVHPRTAMAAMRHSRIELTMNFYTDPVLLDIAGAVEALPNFTKACGDDASCAGTGAYHGLVFSATITNPVRWKVFVQTYNTCLWATSRSTPVQKKDEENQ